MSSFASGWVSILLRQHAMHAGDFLVIFWKGLYVNSNYTVARILCVLPGYAQTLFDGAAGTHDDSSVGWIRF